MPVDRRYRDSVRDKYNSIDDIWAGADQWHRRVHQEIGIGIARLGQLAGPQNLILDIGSAGTAYPLRNDTYVHLDIALEHLKGNLLSVCADAQALPFKASIADCVLCVGPVINYCSLIETIAEIARVLKPRGWLLLHVEFSNSFEHLGTSSYRARADLASTFYRGVERTWIYSKRAVFNAVANAGLEIIATRYFHVLSALAYRCSKNCDSAARWSIFDSWLNKIPGIGEIADSGMIICQKLGE